MRLLLIGYGKVGKLIHELAEKDNHQVVGTCDSKTPLTKEHFHSADVAIDFSTAKGLTERAMMALDAKVPLVIGTTGWEDQREEIQKQTEEKKGSLLYSPNFSIGVLLFIKLIQYAAPLFQKAGGYDTALFEKHHSQKKDAPAGTAKAILRHLEEKKLNPTVGFLRTGFHPGLYSLFFESLDDTIELKHESKNRTSYAKGAIEAASWLQGKTGFFTMEDFLCHKLS